MIWTSLALLFLASSGDAWRSDYIRSIHPRSKTHWGSWGTIDWCPFGYYAYGFRLKVESFQGGYKDDTALNGIILHCKKGRGDTGHQTHIHSSVERWGSWGHSKFCPRRLFLTGVEIKSESHQGSGDDTAANNFKFTCNHRYWRPLIGDGSRWGSWNKHPVACPPKSAICGIRTRVESWQGTKVDDTALNEAIFYCCRK
ncbi:vitelline membrane outer layer protein 1 [Exaiptasia diaphana]|uniref:Vitelline coat lysin M7 n=1 Tax=Exaiptasia diaphana TaxID=2652724 RepID=A0A913YMU5_EXADI|nr:vitelline membrane outer layer protein 1 [Exaiptasia diaphana]